MTSALVIGEALVDIVQRGSAPPEVHPGGSPLNVAIGLSRLGIPTTLHSSFGADEHGRSIARHLEESDVTVTDGTLGDSPTSTAAAVIGADGAAVYDFRIAWDPAATDARGFDLVHTGSIAAFLEPGASLVETVLAGADGLVSFDPNIRPALLPDREDARARTERIVARSHIVKASDEDLAWLYPDQDSSAVLDAWLALGPRVVVVTRGADGADAVTADGRIHVDVPPTTISDTIGAGDSFMAALLADILVRGFTDLAGSVGFAARCAAITVSRPGADPPRRDELSA